MSGGTTTGRCQLGLAVAAVIVGLAGSACLTASRIESAEPVGTVFSRKLAPFVYYEDGALFIGVDGRAAQYVRDRDTIVPIGVGLANQSRRPLSFTRESFVLEGADGRRYPLVSVDECNRGYRRSSVDERLAETFLEHLATRFRNFAYVERRVFPARGSAAGGADGVELDRLTWTHFYLYFPAPRDGTHGREFDLLVRPRAVPQTFVVHFKLE